MSDYTAEMFTARLELMGADPQPSSGPWWSARCIHPEHADDTPSMSYRDGEQHLVVTCHACAPSKDRKPLWLKSVFTAATAGEPLPPADPSKRRRNGNGNGTGHGRRITEYAYRDREGSIVAWKVRFLPKTFIWERPYGQWRSTGLGQGFRLSAMPLYRLPELLALPAGSTIFVVEGERDADNVVAACAAATCSAAGSAGPPDDVSALAGMDVRIVADNDEPGHKSAMRWGDALTGTAASVTYWAGMVPGKGSDISDHLAAGHSLDQLHQVRRTGDRLTLLTGHDTSPEGITEEPPPDDAPPDAGRRHRTPGGSARDKVLGIVESKFTIGRTIDDRTYIVENKGTNIALTSGAAKPILAARVTVATGNSPGRAALDEAWTVIEGMSMAVEKTELPLRVSPSGGSVAVDLGTPDGRCILIHADGWLMAPRSPVTFRRTRATAPLPEPHHGGDWGGLWAIVNVEQGFRDLLRGWLVASLIRFIPHPIIRITGEQGAAKTTASRYLGRLIDPSSVDVLSPPRDMGKWETTVNARWMIPVDNVSSIDASWSDALCRTSTGAGTLDRALYTDDDVTAKFMRGCVILNGITMGGSLRSDLAERMIPIHLHRPREYLSESEVAGMFAARHPKLLGLVLDDLAATLAQLPDTAQPRDMRMADFAHILAAFDIATGCTAASMYRELVGESAADALESDMFARSVIEFMDGRDRWIGSASELLHELAKVLESQEWQPGRRDNGSTEWPSRPNEVHNWLSRSESNLRTAGVQVRRLPRERTSRPYLLTRGEA